MREAAATDAGEPHVGLLAGRYVAMPAIFSVDFQPSDVALHHFLLLDFIFKATIEARLPQNTQESSRASFVNNLQKPPE